MSESEEKFLPIEMLKVDVGFGPIEDKIEQLFTLSFSIKDDPTTTWELNHRFAKFADLNKQIVHALSNFISTEFPKTHRSRAALGFKISDEKLEDRRRLLNLWLREVIASYDLLPNDIQLSLMDFIKIPSCFNISFNHHIKNNTEGALSPVSDISMSLRVNGGATPASSRLSTRSSFTNASANSLNDNAVSSPRVVNAPVVQIEGKVVKLSSLFLNVHEMVEIVTDATSFLHTSTGITNVLCVSRSEHVTAASARPVVRALVEDLLASYAFRPWLTVVAVVFLCSDYSSVRFPLTLILVSLVALASTWYHDQLIVHTRNLAIAKQQQHQNQHHSKTPVGPLQVAVSEFMPQQSVTYNEFYAPAPGCERPKSVPKSRVDTTKVTSPTKPVSNSITSDVSSPQKNAQPEVATTSSFSSVISTSAALSQKDIAESKKKRVMAARKAFDDFEFTDLSPAARAMFVDRKFSHTFQVRGGNYLDDKKKVHPGSAMCKLMLLELYEVESKDGDRHDHIASRGLAKQRREAISALPGNPFVIVANFQIPGDPPISIVTYFALPPDLADRFAEGEVDKFQSLFGRFINIPVNEAERLATWGVTSKTHKHNDDGTVTETDGGGESEEEDGGAHAHATPSPAPAAASGGWMKMPSDISWPDPHEPGALPPTDFRNLRFKLIPSVTEGPWVVKAAVRSQPALLGRKVVQRYFRGEGYMEIDVHVGSSVIASQIVGVCRGYGKHFAADVGIVIQGEDPSELPEKMLACCSFHKIDMEVRQYLD